MREIMLVQGHPYSNDNPEPWEEDTGFELNWKGWLFIGLIVALVLGKYLWNNRRRS